MTQVRIGMNTTVTISSYEELCNELNLRFIRGSETEFTTVYRGHADRTWQLKPSVFRDDKLKFETQIIQTCKEKFPYEFYGQSTLLEDLAKLQHYGASTRLMDVSVDPYVAAFFSCYNKTLDDKDGEIICFSVPLTQADSIQIKAICFYAQYDFYKLGSGKFYNHLRNYLGYNYSDRYLFRLLEGVHCVVPPINSERIGRQKGNFILFGICPHMEFGKLEKEEHSFEEYTYPGICIFRKIIIPSALKSDIRKNLELAGYTQDFLIPDIQKEFGIISSGK